VATDLHPALTFLISMLVGGAITAAGIYWLLRPISFLRLGVLLGSLIITSTSAGSYRLFGDRSSEVEEQVLLIRGDPTEYGRRYPQHKWVGRANGFVCCVIGILVILIALSEL
jgi:hypothetical protein